MEIFLFIGILLGAIVQLAVGRRVHAGMTWGVAGLVLAFGVSGAAMWKQPDRRPEGDLPAVLDGMGYAKSDRCRGCHPSEYASWRASFHRTMTQRAAPSTVLAPFQGRLENKGRGYRLERHGAEFWVEMVDPGWEMRKSAGTEAATPDQAPRIRQQVVMTTGSHHMQTYWTGRSDSSGMLFQLPWIYRISDNRWIPSEDSFLRPPSDEATIEISIWNSSCIVCHAVGGQPRIDLERKTMFSRVAELGIACEACHGPAEDHGQANRSIFRRYTLHLEGSADSTIVNPARLAPDRAAEVCGQCHSASNEIREAYWTSAAQPYRPGQPLAGIRRVLRYSEEPAEDWVTAGLREDPDALEGRFWKDGTIRVAGREYNALLESACHRRGALSCLSCHKIHRSDPSDQLGEGMETDAACLQCHGSFRSRISEHTRHAESSGGSRCYNCHMPYTTYGLFTAMRSHRIDNPSAALSVRTGRPNACNLCHLDRTLGWTARYLSEWYGEPPVTLAEDDSEIAASVRWLLEGDAVQRVIAAWSMGWASARTASGQDFQVPLLAQLLTDPYSAVRSVAFDSLRRMPGFESFAYDFVGDSGGREERRRHALEMWERLRRPSASGDRAVVLLDAHGDLRREIFERLLRRRNDRPVSIIE